MQNAEKAFLEIVILKMSMLKYKIKFEEYVNKGQRVLDFGCGVGGFLLNGLCFLIEDIRSIKCLV